MIAMRRPYPSLETYLAFWPFREVAAAHPAAPISSAFDESDEAGEPNQ